jgi:hypothetical protein
MLDLEDEPSAGSKWKAHDEASTSNRSVRL